MSGGYEKGKEEVYSCVDYCDAGERRDEGRVNKK